MQLKQCHISCGSRKELEFQQLTINGNIWTVEGCIRQILDTHLVSDMLITICGISVFLNPSSVKITVPSFSRTHMISSDYHVFVTVPATIYQCTNNYCRIRWEEKIDIVVKLIVSPSMCINIIRSASPICCDCLNFSYIMFKWSMLPLYLQITYRIMQTVARYWDSKVVLLE